MDRMMSESPGSVTDSVQTRKSLPHAVPSIFGMKDPAMGGDAENCSDQKNSHNKRKREENKEEFKRPYLPIDDVRLGIKDLLMENPVNVIIAETGSGKSTQIPQICHQIGLTDGGKMIAVSQPRRVAAISLAHRVAQEMNSEIGRKVGYHVRFEQMKSDETRVLYLTDGMLLRETMNDVYLNDYSVVIIDEAHERSLHTDVLFAVLRTVQKSRKKENMDPLRIVIMSATLQAELFSEYFDDVPVYVISGRTFPVDVFYANSLNSSSSDYVYWSTITILQVHQREPIEDDVLVFLTGKEEIEHVAQQLRNFNTDLNQKLHVVPLYAALSPAAQMRAFQPAPQGHRKVVLATNIAETSITIPGIRVVIDSGKVKTKSFTASDRTDVLKVHDISKSQAKQRAGRAGREAPGKCYR
ncbi:hypothetical protein WR25_13988 [Diploscapter pachys]|uniref:RNA helicase n=1 Tax=Diploscapter pachys TaxID=2018661 RepID=A0A2A2KVT2_9BILA|nr:hypothetical protein WR25_13988 [Diploscapter pachys]